MRDKLATGIIILAFAVSAISPYWILFVIPLFLVGVIVLWTTKRTIKLKLLWTIVPILVWLPTVYFFIYADGKLGKWTAQKFDLIFPDKFHGRAVIIGDMQCGQEIIKKDGREQLVIPDNGVLLYKGKIESGYINHKYFQADSLNHLVELQEIGDYMFWDEAKEKPSTKLVGVFIGEFGTRSVSIGQKIEYSYVALTLSSKDDIETYREFKYTQQIEAVTDSLVRKCVDKKTAHNKVHNQWRGLVQICNLVF